MKNQFFQHTQVETRRLCDAEMPMVQTDNLFLAVALLVVDRTLKKASEAPQDTAVVFNRYFALFPQAQPKSLREFVRQRMISPIQAQRFLNHLAYALRQIAADSLIAWPEKYHPIFYRGRQQLTEKHLRSMDEELPLGVFHVLAQALQVHFQLTCSEWGKDIPSKHLYGDARHETRHLNYADGWYGFKPSHRDLCVLAVLKAQAVEAPSCMTPADDGALTRRLEAQAHCLMMAYVEHAQRLLAMEKAQELVASHLQTLYIDHLVSSTEAASIVGLEQGTQSFFCQLFARMTPPMQAKLSLISQGVSPQIKELICAVSRAIALGTMDEKNAYDVLEQPIAPLNRAQIS